MSDSWLELEMKKRSDLESNRMASLGRWAVVVMSLGVGVDGEICFAFRYLGQLPGSSISRSILWYARDPT